jgi:hypothetical protein
VVYSAMTQSSPIPAPHLSVRRGDKVAMGGIAR